MTVCAMYERNLEFDDSFLARELFGPGNDHLTLLTKESGVDLQTRGAALTVRGPDEKRVERVSNLLVQAYGLLKQGTRIYAPDLLHGLHMLARQPGAKLKDIFQDAVFVVSPKRTITPKTLSQKVYVDAIRSHDLVFGIGPAGTGKTFLAVALAVSYLLSKQVKRIILIRPAVEAGEKLGFLPGDMAEKVNPYLRPMYDALHDMLDYGKVNEMLENGVIEVAPLAFMRGRTLNDAFIIMDEAQNTTPEQMKMVLTRLGFGSRAVVTGDVTQIDLPPAGGRNGHTSERSGLVQAEKILSNVEGVRFVHFHAQDVIRHPLVARIVKAYESNA